MNTFIVTWRFYGERGFNSVTVQAWNRDDALRNAYAQLGSHPLMQMGNARLADPSESSHLAG